jgi:nitrogen-specific signal transduction histidine kinase
MEDRMSDAFSEDVPFRQDQIHDIRNRLTVVKGVAQLLERQVRRDDWQRDKIITKIESLQDEIQRLEALVERYTCDDASGRVVSSRERWPRERSD